MHTDILPAADNDAGTSPTTKAAEAVTEAERRLEDALQQLADAKAALNRAMPLDWETICEATNWWDFMRRMLDAEVRLVSGRSILMSDATNGRIDEADYTALEQVGVGFSNGRSGRHNRQEEQQPFFDPLCLPMRLRTRLLKLASSVPGFRRVQRKLSNRRVAAIQFPLPISRGVAQYPLASWKAIGRASGV